MILELVLSGVVFAYGTALLFPRAHSLLGGNINEVLSRGQEIRVRRFDALAKFLERDLRITIEVKATNYRYQLCLQGLMTHFLQEDAQGGLSEVTKAWLIDGLKGAP